MNQKKPYIVPDNIPTCYVDPEIMKQFDDELDEEYWSHLLDHIEKLNKPKKRNHARMDK